MKRVQRLTSAAALCLLLAACGGGGSDASVPDDPLAAVPDGATRSAPTMVAYLDSLTKVMSEVREAIDLTLLASMFTSDDTEPEAVP